MDPASIWTARLSSSSAFRFRRAAFCSSCDAFSRIAAAFARSFAAFARSFSSLSMLPPDTGCAMRAGTVDPGKAFRRGALPVDREDLLRGVRLHPELRGGPPHAAGGRIPRPFDRLEPGVRGRERPRDLHGRRNDGAEDAPENAG